MSSECFQIPDIVNLIDLNTHTERPRVDGMNTLLSFRTTYTHVNDNITIHFVKHSWTKCLESNFWLVHFVFVTLEQ